MTMENNTPEKISEISASQDRIVDLLMEAWESQERGRLVEPPRWAQ